LKQKDETLIELFQSKFQSANNMTDQVSRAVHRREFTNSEKRGRVLLLFMSNGKMSL